MEVSIYPTDTYADMKRNLHAAWPNLSFEVHHAGPALWKGGADELSDNARMINADVTASPAYTITDKTIAKEVADFLGKHFEGEVLIWGPSGGTVAYSDSLENCNNPFMLPLYIYPYSEYKQRFTAQWANLSVTLYDHQFTYAELADDVILKNKNSYYTTLHDHIYIFEWLRSLHQLQLSADITNNRLGITWKPGMRIIKLKPFNMLEKSADVLLIK